ncbi:uncharacterized protein LOC132264733 [Phlebotomus argentipes]|uniref:uncharacterized protein LOC132264733 n=1 Tax=Phlebotomus argentipes TaxID=94469 RepID=UPI002892C103|nr:uncharacterized protein LOC132264733 [Phlebotomus argentipes]
MEFFCENRFNNIPVDVEFHMNGRDAGEFEGSPPVITPIGTPPDSLEHDWELLNREICSFIEDTQETTEVPPPPPPPLQQGEFADWQFFEGVLLYQACQEELIYRELSQELRQQQLKVQKKVKRQKKSKEYCVFCFNNKESPQVYLSHSVKDAFDNVVCPRLFKYVCPICGQSGRKAHTTKYCPEKPIVTMELADQLHKKKLNRMNTGYSM